MVVLQSSNVIFALHLNEVAKTELEEGRYWMVRFSVRPRLLDGQLNSYKHL